MKKFTFIFTISAALFFACCSHDDTGNPIVEPEPDNTIDRTTVTSNYADLVLANYQAAMVDAEALEVAINTFTADPTQANFDSAKKAWLTSRESYGPSEAFRFANGPIDTGETGDIEGYLNSWPLDEVYIDYVEGIPDSGIINNLGAFPTLNKELLTTENQKNGGEEDVSIGYHAIEFLLWGQDLTAPSEEIPGQRPYTDFVDGGTADHQDRRREYLNICADLITDHLQVVIDEWSGSYKETFLGLDNDQALDNIIMSLAELSRSELAVERMEVALFNKSQEDEHSCFSDNTDRDIRLNLQGVANVYKGEYGDVNGNSLKDLIAEADVNLGDELDALLADAETKVDATLDPFDLAISEGESSPEGEKVSEAINALKAFGDQLLEARAALGID